MRRTDLMPAEEACALLAVSQGLRNFHDIRLHCDFLNVAATAEILGAARRRGLVDWEPGRFDTVRLLVTPQGQAA